MLPGVASSTAFLLRRVHPQWARAVPESPLVGTGAALPTNRRPARRVRTSAGLAATAQPTPLRPRPVRLAPWTRPAQRTVSAIYPDSAFERHQVLTMDDAPSVLRDFSVVAVVGLSRDPSKAAHAVPAKLQAAGFRIVPVNPEAKELLSERAFASLRDIPFPIELVLVFRPARFAPAIAEQAVAIGAKAIWLQQGIISSEARRIAERAGLRYVEDRCAAVERAIHGIVKRPSAT